MKRNSAIPTVITDSLKADGTFVDNTVASTQDELGLKGIFKALKIKKRSSESTLEQIVYALLIMPLLAVNNIYCFAGKFLNVYIPGGQDILYNFLSKQNINWSLVQLRLSQRLYQTVYTDNETTAFVVDDTIKRRRGKRVQAMSSHYDHNEGRHVMGQQILQFGIASPKGFLPLSSQIFVGKTKATERKKKFKDKRNRAKYR